MFTMEMEEEMTVSEYAEIKVKVFIPSEWETVAVEADDAISDCINAIRELVAERLDRHHMTVTVEG